MKRLFLTFGLVIAFFFTAQLSATTIFEISSNVPPNIKSNETWQCFEQRMTFDACIALSKSKIQSQSTSSEIYEYKGVVSLDGNLNFEVRYNVWNVVPTNANGGYYQFAKDKIFNMISRREVTDSRSCPPDSAPNYTFSYFEVGKSEVSKCYNPDELDNASNCANQVASMLPALTNLSTKVCKTNQDSGARCGYSKKDGDLVYKLDLEMNCFGDSDNQVPEYNPEPMPEPSNCAKYNDGLMVCKEKPENKCDANGNCQDQCGFFNKEFYCFINCSGEECDKETPPPVNCETNPTAPVCVEEPDPNDPDFCKNNPTDPKCQTPPPDGGGDGDGGSTGGGGSNIDLKPVVDQLKGLNDKLDFSTTQNDSTRKMGLLETAFDEDAISELKSKTDEIKTEINGFYTSTKAEISSMFSFSTGGGSYEPITFAFTYGTYSSKIWEYFSQNVAYIAAAIMFLAYLMAARIVLE
ncbi:hypothetical protein N5C36_21540 [Shewanella xiamenensis]|uniref:hypothetical protein n=1 Tax=Shewanella xiamenensis TaxID=332186 RepID=UPI00244776A5|nr:hypothetical protein [Shewanella xiamenensis]MDH1316656.1 hypothetical protein [Shewanella xiamenensis]